MDIFILPQCHQQPAATNLCGFYVVHHMKILMRRVSTSKDIPEDVVCMQNIFSSIEILICTGSDMIQFTEYRIESSELPQTKLSMLRSDLAVFLIKNVLKSDGEFHFVGFDRS